MDDAVPTILNETDLRRVLAERPDGLRNAVMRGASLRQLDLEGADLSGADLSGAHLVRAKLKGAKLEETNLEGADLANVDLSCATLADANLENAMFEHANLGGTMLRFVKARHGFFENANLASADLLSADLREAELAGANLRGAVLEQAKLAGADLTGANLEGATLIDADFTGARLVGASLVGAKVRGASFKNAVLSKAQLSALDLTSCDLRGVHLARTWLDKTQLEHEQFGGALGEELAQNYGEAKRAYLAVERNFLELGDQHAAGWSYGKRRRMQKLEARAAARAAWSRHERRAAVRLYGSYAGDQLVEWLCDYGESIFRVFATIVVLYLAFTVLYAVTGSVVRTHEAGPPQATRRPIDLLIFSLLAMTTSGSPGMGLQPRAEFVYLLTGIQALMGIALTGLLGFVIGNRIRR